MTKKKDRFPWYSVHQALTKWRREMPLTLEDRRLLLAAQNEDINRYRTLRQKVRDEPLEIERCF